MATPYVNATNLASPFMPRHGSVWLMATEATRVYVVDDTVDGPKLAKGIKVVGARLSFSAEPDSNGAPAAIFKVRAMHATETPVDLVVCTAAQAGTAAGFVQDLNQPAGVEFLTEQEGWYLQLICSTGPATGATAVAKFGAEVQSILTSAQQILVET